MSDLTSLSEEYTANADFAEELNGTVMWIKKTALGRTARPPEGKSINDVRRKLATVLCEFRYQLSDKTSQKPAERSLIPEDILERLRNKHRTSLAYLVQELEVVAKDLSEGQRLDKKNLDTLDELCDVADASASATFRRMRRR